MKILIASDAYYPPNVSGLAYFSYRLATSLARRGNRVFVITPSRKFKNTTTIEDGVVVYGITSVPLPVYNNFRVSPTTFINSNVDKIIKKIKPDVIHIQTHFTIGKLAAETGKKYGIPVVGTNHFMPENLVHYLHLPKPIEKELIHLSWNDFMKVYKNVDYVTTPTVRAANLLKNIGFSKKIEPISNGIDLTRFNPRNNGDYLKRRYNIPDGIPILLFVGRLDKEKNIDVIIRSMPQILKSKKAHLVVAGTGAVEKSLQSLVEEMKMSKSVTFTGFVPDKDLPALYAIANIFIASGTVELQCIAALEAMATGVPLVAADAVALPELVKEGKNGFLFTPGSHKSLADRIIKIILNKNLARKMHTGSLRIAKMHNMEAVISQFEALYQKAIELKSAKLESSNEAPFYQSREFGLKFAFVMIILAVLFKISLASPAVARARGTFMKSKIMNSTIVKNIENFDSKLKTALPIRKLGK